MSKRSSLRREEQNDMMKRRGEAVPQCRHTSNDA